MIEIKVPPVGESISEVTLVTWMKKDGEWVERDEVLCELESEKATFELNAEQAGILHIVAQEGDTLNIGDLACKIDETAARPEGAAPAAAPVAEAPKQEAPAAAPAPAKEAPAALPADVKATPVAKSIMSDKKVNPAAVHGSGANGRIFKADVLAALENPGRPVGKELYSREEKAQKMSNLRKTVSRRLVEAKNTTAMLTTFNEVDMTNIMAIRKQYKDKFKETHGVNLGFMSFFTKACTIALMEWPAVNAYIDGDNIIYHEYADISIAVSAPKGLVVPVIRNAESMSMAEIEGKVLELAKKARENKLTIEEMTGGTFTITNGGVFGSLMSTPIINIPQSAILGMHKIQERPMVIDGEIKIRPMMYVALSYDHRIIDGRESVGFLVRVKELLENPELMLIGKSPTEALLEL
ncbi:MAG TPA: 2-oxoglutarate dehydrogenase complex dihydrolipoyllysine-residue succinyltransferase [Edaphocola sp.]|nr:2-oxoglutarate dehydrogenase complex dihydrolipoyllysine-residue succinyltransferase [Edaphocola sp.]